MRCSEWELAWVKQYYIETLIWGSHFAPAIPWDGRISREEARIQHLKMTDDKGDRLSHGSKTSTPFWTKGAAPKAHAKSRFCARPRGLPDSASLKPCGTRGRA